MDPMTALVILGGMDEAVVVADGGGIITFWNAAAERMFGWPEAEAVGQTLDLIIPERLRSRHWEGWRRVMASGETAYAGKLLVVPAQTKYGTKLSLEFSVTIVASEDPSRPVGSVAAVMRDVTARWVAERERGKGRAES